MSGKRTRALRLELRAFLPEADQSDHRAYRKTVRELRQMKVGTPRPRRRHQAVHIFAVAGDGGQATGLCLGTRMITPGLGRWTVHIERSTCSACRAKWNVFALDDGEPAIRSYEPRSRPRKTIYDGKLAKLSHRRFWG